MEAMDEINSLLTKVNVVCVKRKEREEQALKRGENFNIFEILGIESDETLLHSKLLAHFLNPQGSHGLGAEPLRLFLIDVCENTFPDFDVAEAIVRIEHCIGTISNDYTEGGRIDIIISDKSHSIVIENKIYAGDQPCQIVRYHRHCIDEGKEFRLLYLTLDGYEASDDSTCGLKCGHDYYAISYRNDIIQWLERCRLLAIDHPLTRETLRQYIKTLLNLTNQDMTKEEKADLFTVLETYCESALEIIQNSLEFNYYLIKKHVIKPLENWAMDNNLSCEITGQLATGEIYSGIKFYKSDWKYAIKLEFEKREFQDMIIGICNDKKGNRGILLPGFKENSESWPYGWRNVKYPNLYHQNFSDMKNGTVVKNLIEELKNILMIIETNPEKYPMTD